MFIIPQSKGKETTTISIRPSTKRYLQFERMRSKRSISNLVDMMVSYFSSNNEQWQKLLTGIEKETGKEKLFYMLENQELKDILAFLSDEDLKQEYKELYQ